MGRKRKTRKKTTSSKGLDLDIAVIIFIILGILSCVIIYGNAGVVGEKLGPFLGSCLGRIKYAIPIAIFAAALAITKGWKIYKS